MVAATLHDIVRRYQEADFGSKKDVRLSFDCFPDKVCYRYFFQENALIT